MTRLRLAPAAALSFPNDSRSYDATRCAIRFWGYDGALERSFLIAEQALRHVRPGVAPNEEGLLRAFDLNRSLIYAAASKVYARGRKGFHELVASDF
ncbi:MAG: DUF1488 domain-containing protein [Rhodomicrobium sp.]